MRLQVIFQGLCLFTTRKSDHLGSFTVLLPDARKRRKMKDGTKAEKHTPAVMLADGFGSTNILTKWPLDATRVLFRPMNGAAGSPAPGASGIDHVPHINAFAEKLKQNWELAKGSAVGCVELDVGGALGTIDESGNHNRDWFFGGALRPRHGHSQDIVAEAVVWEVDYPQGVQLVLDPAPARGPIQPFTESTTLYIVNVCDRPIDAPRRTGRAPSPGSLVADQDFKWFYNLLESTTSKTIKDRIERANDSLPVPVAVTPRGSNLAEANKMPDTPTCLCGFFCECHP